MAGKGELKNKNGQRGPNYNKFVRNMYAIGVLAETRDTRAKDKIRGTRSTCIILSLFVVVVVGDGYGGSGGGKVNRIKYSFRCISIKFEIQSKKLISTKNEINTDKQYTITFDDDDVNHERAGGGGGVTE